MTVEDMDARRRFASLALPHADAAYNLALRLTRSPETAQDIVQDAYVRALASLTPIAAAIRGPGF